MATDVVLVALAGFLLGLGLLRFGRAYLRYRGTRVVTCPPTGRPAAVEVAAGRAALTAIVHQPKLHLDDCSRWPPHGGKCGQDCLRQIEAAPEDCLLRKILTNWYQGKACVFCGRPMGEINWVQHKPCLVGPGQRILEWKDFRPEEIPGVLETHSPVCWTCLVADTHTS